MSAKLCAIALLGTTILLTQAVSWRQATAETCANQCPAPELQFTPGQYIKVQVMNRTGHTVGIEKVMGQAPTFLKPGQVLKFRRGGLSDPKVSIVFWDTTGVFLKAKLAKPTAETLQIDLRPGGQNPGDQSVYIKNDGRVEIF